MDSTVYLFYFVLFSLWLIPIIGLILEIRLKIRKDSKFFRSILIFNFIIIIFLILKISFVFAIVNWTILLFLYLEICYLIWIGNYHKKKMISITSKIVMTIVFGIGYLLSTIGIFVLFMTIAENTPERTQRINSSIVYKEYNVGFATSSFGGIIICLYKNYKYFPFLEMKIFEKEFINDNSVDKHINKIYPENSKINNKPSFLISHFKVKYDSLKNEIILQSDNNYDTLHLNEPY